MPEKLKTVRKWRSAKNFESVLVIFESDQYREDNDVVNSVQSWESVFSVEILYFLVQMPFKKIWTATKSCANVK